MNGAKERSKSFWLPESWEHSGQTVVRRRLESPELPSPVVADQPLPAQEQPCFIPPGRVSGGTGSSQGLVQEVQRVSQSIVPSAPRHQKGMVVAGLCSEQQTRLQRLFPSQAFQAASCFPSHAGAHQASIFRGCCRLQGPVPAQLCSRKGFSHKFPVASWDSLLKQSSTRSCLAFK